MNYQQQQFRPRGFTFLPPVVKNLLIINGLMFIATLALQTRGIDLNSILGLRYFQSEAFRPYQFVTYMFMHSTDGFYHILFNMFALWMFGYALENVWGSKRFLTYYMITGIGAAIFHYAIFYFEIQPVVSQMNVFINNGNVDVLESFVSQHTFQLNQYSGEIYTQFLAFQNDIRRLGLNPDDRKAMAGAVNFMTEYKEYFLNLPNVIGASGAVYGILLAFGMIFPETRLYVYFLFPIKAKYFVIIFGLIELYLGFAQSNSNVAHFAHLGGMIFGFFLIKYWKRKGVY